MRVRPSAVDSPFLPYPMYPPSPCLSSQKNPSQRTLVIFSMFRTDFNLRVSHCVYSVYRHGGAGVDVERWYWEKCREDDDVPLFDLSKGSHTSLGLRRGGEGSSGDGGRTDCSGEHVWRGGRRREV